LRKATYWPIAISNYLLLENFLPYGWVYSVTWQFSLSPFLRLPVGGDEGKVGHTYLRPKDSNAMVMQHERHVRGMTDVTDRQTNFLSIIIRLGFMRVLWICCSVQV